MPMVARLAADIKIDHVTIAWWSYDPSFYLRLFQREAILPSNKKSRLCVRFATSYHMRLFWEDSQLSPPDGILFMPVNAHIPRYLPINTTLASLWDGHRFDRAQASRMHPQSFKRVNDVMAETCMVCVWKGPLNTGIRPRCAQRPNFDSKEIQGILKTQ